MVARGAASRATRCCVIPQRRRDRAARAARSGARAAARRRRRRAAPIVGTLARLVELKDLPTLVRAARHVVDAVPDVRFVVGGEGPARARSRRCAASSTSTRTSSCPARSTAARSSPGLDVAVLTSSSEGMPNFVVEAMAAGVPRREHARGRRGRAARRGRARPLAPIGDARALGDGILAHARTSPAPAPPRRREGPRHDPRQGAPLPAENYRAPASTRARWLRHGSEREAAGSRQCVSYAPMSKGPVAGRGSPEEVVRARRRRG